MLISSFLPSIGGQDSEQRHFSLTGRGAGFSGRTFSMIIITKATKKQANEIVSTWRQNWLLLYNESEKVMATHSSNLAWKIPWMEEPGRLQSMGSLTVGHD